MKAFQGKRMVKDTFLDDGSRSQQQPEIRKNGKERHTQDSGQKGWRELSGAPSMDKSIGGLNKPCYYASVRIIYVAPFYHPLPFFIYISCAL